MVTGRQGGRLSGLSGDTADARGDVREDGGDVSCGLSLSFIGLFALEDQAWRSRCGEPLGSTVRVCTCGIQGPATGLASSWIGVRWGLESTRPVCGRSNT